MIKMKTSAANLSIMTRDRPPLPLLLYDGDCPYCNRAVWWLMKRLPAPLLFFASLQAPHVQLFLQRQGYPPDYDESVVLITPDHRIHTGMEAIAKALQRLRFPWSWIGVLLGLLPPPVGRWLYRRVAESPLRRRSKGRTCRWPGPTEQRFFWHPPSGT